MLDSNVDMPKGDVDALLENIDKQLLLKLLDALIGEQGIALDAAPTDSQHGGF